ncbi:MAG TPA: hypothetical protein VMV92_17080 [Streptosporangiaceae bacterium]|nr:hypothetical protein [Streptosporangiaceae bacterium]
MWDQIRVLHACHGDVPAEIQLLKLTEEVGQDAVQAKLAEEAKSCQ